MIFIYYKRYLNEKKTNFIKISITTSNQFWITNVTTNSIRQNYRTDFCEIENCYKKGCFEHTIDGFPKKKIMNVYVWIKFST